MLHFGKIPKIFGQNLAGFSKILAKFAKNCKNISKIQEISDKFCKILFKETAKFSASVNEHFEIRERCKGVHCVDLAESFQTHIFLQNLTSEEIWLRYSRERAL